MSLYLLTRQRGEADNPQPAGAPWSFGNGPSLCLASGILWDIMATPSPTYAQIPLLGHPSPALW